MSEFVCYDFPEVGGLESKHLAGHTIRFTVYAEPVAQGRPKFTTIGGHVKAYDPQKSRSYKEYVKLVASQHRPEKLLEGAVGMYVSIYRSIPKGFSKTKHALAVAKRLRPTTKPDADNVLKGVKDALKGVMWRDDSQVVKVTAEKFYGDTPRVEIAVWTMEDGEQGC